MLQRLRNYFAPEACAKRQFERERAALVVEMNGIKGMRLYGYSREQTIQRRVKALDHAISNVPERRVVPFLAPALPKFMEEDDACLSESWLHGVASEARP